MKVGERGQVTIPKDIRDRFKISPETQLEFLVIDEQIILRKSPKPLNLEKWKGHCAKSSAELGYASVEEFIDGVRGPLDLRDRSSRRK